MTVFLDDLYETRSLSCQKWRTAQYSRALLVLTGLIGSPVIKHAPSGGQPETLQSGTTAVHLFFTCNPDDNNICGRILDFPAMNKICLHLGAYANARACICT